MPEKELVQLVLQGDVAAFRLIVERTEKLVLHIISGLVSSREDQQDLAQDTYLKAFHHLRNFQYESKLSTWIGRIAYNTCISHLRKKRIKISISDEAAPGMEPESGNDPFTMLSSREVSVALQRAIQTLQPLHCTLITLFHQDALGIAEIAQITGLPEGTVKSYLYRARRELQKYLLTNYINREAL
ncbi:RNA polymerase sigma factor [Chitinophaga pollutisoli]|uniref:RNA polymerase sigma factor n=1 Tax=Chitinophaga pollutisoli TaxID=3133966 RepID=A0ABZ2YLW6_9BACT